MPEKVRGSAAGALNPGSRKGQSNDVSNGRRPRQANGWRVNPTEHAATFTDAAIFTEVLSQRRPNIVRQGQGFNYTSFAANDDFANAPANVVQFEGDYLARSQPKPGKQQ